MSKRTLFYQSAGGLLGLACLNLVVAPIASAANCCTNMSNGSGYNMSNGTGNMSNGSGGNGSNGSGSCPDKKNCGGNMSNGSGGNMSNGSGGNGSNGSGKPPTECKDLCNPGTGGSGSGGSGSFGGSGSGFSQQGGSYFVGSSKVPGLFSPLGTGIGGYNASTIGLTQQYNQLLSTAQSALADASAKVAQLQSQATPAGKKDDPVRYSRVADANIADCGCNATASEPANSAELAAAKAAEAEAAASLAKAQEQARQFLASLKNNPVAFGSASPIW